MLGNKGMQSYRFKSDKVGKIRLLKVDVDEMTGAEFCSLLADHTFKGKSATCTFVPVNCDGRDIFETKKNVIVVDQAYAQKFKAAGSEFKIECAVRPVEPGEIIESDTVRQCSRGAVPTWHPRSPVRRWHPRSPVRRWHPRSPVRRWRSRSPVRRAPVKRWRSRSPIGRRQKRKWNKRRSRRM